MFWYGHFTYRFLPDDDHSRPNRCGSSSCRPQATSRRRRPTLGGRFDSRPGQPARRGAHWGSTSSGWGIRQISFWRKIRNPLYIYKYKAFSSNGLEFLSLLIVACVCCLLKRAIPCLNGKNCAHRYLNSASMFSSWKIKIWKWVQFLRVYLPNTHTEMLSSMQYSKYIIRIPWAFRSRYFSG